MATEFIERQAAIDACCFNCSESNICVGTCDDTDRIRNIPIADVRPVRRGRWERVDPRSTVVTFRCSECNYYAHMNATNFCPNCGADMRNGDVE